MQPTFLIIGASSGIGFHICSALAGASESHVIGSSRVLEKVAKLHQNPQFEPAQCDVTDENSVKQLFESLAARSLKLSGIVNCAGSVLLKPSHLTSLAEFDATLTINLTSCFLLLKYGIPMMAPEGGSFLFFSTAALAAGVPNHDAICAAKSGVEGLTRAAAGTYASKNIRVNAIAPGLVKTPLTARIHGNPNAAQASAAMHALGRLGEPADVASLAVWLLSPAAAGMTGQVITIDGGLGLKTKA